jgi:TRAP-type C4-dicarboxylate transport system permease small subunit
MKIAAVLLIVAGALGLIYGGFTYTKNTQEAKVGPVELSVKENKTIVIPIWVGLGAIVIGGMLFFLNRGARA